MNGNSGIVPTVDLATNNGYGYPAYPMMGGYGNGFGFGGDGIWALIILAVLFGGGNFGNWGNNGWNNVATTDYVSSEFTQRDILTQTNELNTNLLTTQLNAQAQLDKCCCDLRAQGLENTQRILDALNQNTIQDLRDRLQAAENKLSDDNVINTVLPRSVPAYITASPYQSIIPFGWNNGFYGNGFYGNTIV